MKMWLIFLIFLLYVVVDEGKSVIQEKTLESESNGAVPLAGVANIPDSELNALHSLYNSTSGATWDWVDGLTGHWVFSGDPQPCDSVNPWQGLTCVTFQNQYFVESISLSGYNLTGRLPSDLDTFSFLTTLDLSANSIIGTIPEELYNNTILTELILSNNFISGSLSSSVEKLKKLQTLNIAANNLNGTIPNSIGNLLQLQTIALMINELSGQIPTTIVSLTQLTGLGLYRNKLTGKLPEEIGLLINLFNVQIYANFLTSTLPSSVTQLQKLRNFYIYENKFNGTLPKNIGNMTALTDINFNSNRFTGSIPSSLLILTQLKEIVIAKNELTGTIPENINLLSELTVLELFSNKLNSTIPESITKLTKLEILYLYDNYLNGTIPSTIGNLVNLEECSLDSNQLSGSIPTSLSNLIKLKSLMLYNNYLTGTIGTSLMSLSQIEYLDVSYNLFNGSLPSDFRSLSNSLEKLYLNNNFLTGSIDNSIMTLSKIMDLDFAFNNLNGTIPDNFNSLSNTLEKLYLNNNLFTGTIPEDLFQMRLLFFLYLDNNQLHGNLPTNISSRCILEEIELSNNTLTGPIPETITKCSILLTLTLNGNLLSQSLPFALFDMQKLEEFELYDNAITGELPSNICNLDIVLYLDFGSNNLQGSIPNGCFFNTLEGLGLDGNQMTGKFPSWEFTKIVNLNLGNNFFSGNIFEWLEGNPLLEYFFMNNNLLSGSISSNISNNYVLNEIEIYNNFLSGKLPTELNELEILGIFLANNNEFTGSLDDVFNLPGTLLSNLDLSSNQFTGTIPSQIFNNPNLQVIALAANCFHGSIPSNICGCQYLSGIEMDGMSTANKCKTRFFPHSSKYQSYYLQESGSGNIPSCLFNLPYLQTLHLSGNLLTGSIPEDVQLSVDLVELVLSHNILTGSIPLQFQQKQWKNFDLSFNKINGKLQSSFSVQLNTSSIILKVNRLSGNIASAIQVLTNVDVLDGNMFSCNYKRNNLPKHDANERIYQCGSNSLNNALYIYCGVIGFLGLTLLYLKIYYYPPLSTVNNWIITIWNNVNYKEFCRAFSLLRLYWLGIMGFICTILLPAYAVLHVHYSMYTVSYSWEISAAYLSGMTPAITLFVLWILLSAFAFIGWMLVRRNSINHVVPESYKVSFKLTSFVIVMVDMSVVTLVNVAYVYINRTYNSTEVFLMQIFVALFKLWWNGIVLNGLLKKIKGKESQNLALHIQLRLFNNIVAPFIATAFISSDCFYNVFVTPPTVSTEFEVSTCVSVVEGNDDYCAEYSISETTTSYVPPFIYTYQCASFFIAAYTDVYVYLFIAISFTVLLWQFSLYQSLKILNPAGKIFHLLHSFQWKLLRNETESSELVHQTIDILQVDAYAVEVVSSLGILMTFGVIFPPLAIVIVGSLIIRTLVKEALVGRILTQPDTKFANSDLCSAIVNESLQIMSQLNQSLWGIVPVTSFFYAYLLFDTLGDKVGWKRALWLPLVVISTPICVWSTIKILSWNSKTISKSLSMESVHEDKL